MKRIVFSVFVLLSLCLNAGLISHVVSYNMGKDSNSINRQLDIENELLRVQNQKLQQEIERLKQIIKNSDISVEEVCKQMQEDVENKKKLAVVYGSAVVVILILVVCYMCHQKSKRRKYRLRYGRGYYD